MEVSYQQWPICESLKEYAQYFWMLQGKPSPGQSHEEIIMPDDTAHIVYHSGNACQRFSDRNELIADSSINFALIGNFEKYYSIRFEGPFFVSGVRLIPGMAAVLFNKHGKELTNRIINLEELPFGKDCAVKLGRSPSPKNHFKELEIYLNYCIHHIQKDYQVLLSAILLIREKKGILEVKKEFSQMEKGIRQLERQFNKMVGMSPKRHARMVKLQAILKSLSLQDFDTFTDLAYDFGYFDQAHFNHDFKALTGFAPSLYLKKKPPIGHLLYANR